MIDRIYKLWKDAGGKIRSRILIQDDLNFDKLHPIEAISFFETEDIKKVYWIDGKNQPRFINIEQKPSKILASNLNFAPDLRLEEKITITKIPVGRGVFPAGTIQYAFTYFNLYGQESNIVYLSDIYYNSFYNRGGSPEEVMGNAFKITINRDYLDFNFDCIRIYSIVRSSADAQVYIRKVVDLSTNNDDSTNSSNIVFIDTGEHGEALNDTHLLFVGGEPLISKTICQKDNTLFLGNIDLPIPNVGSGLIKSSYIRDILKDKASIKWAGGKLLATNKELESLYGYKPQLDKTQSEISFFKRGNYYRFGVQFQHISGKWSEPIFLLDSLCNIGVSSQILGNDVVTSGNSATITIQSPSADSWIAYLISYGYVKARGVIVYPEGNDKTVICQGIVTPTIFNVADRYHGNPYAISSWFARPKITFTYGTTTSLLEYRHYNALPPNTERGSEVEGTIDKFPHGPVITAQSSETLEDARKRFVNAYKENFFVDASIVTFHSPDIEFDDNIHTIDDQHFDIVIVGAINLTGLSSDVYVDANPSEMKNGGFLKKTLHINNINEINGGGVFGSAPLWSDYVNIWPKEDKITMYKVGDEFYDSALDALLNVGVSIDVLNDLDDEELHELAKERDDIKIKFKSIVKKIGYAGYYIVYPWASTAPLSAGYEDSDATPSRLIQKKVANLRYSAYNTYLKTPINCGDSQVKLFDSTDNNTVRVNPDGDAFSYQGNIDKIIMPSLYLGDGIAKSSGYPKVVLYTGDKEVESTPRPVTQPANLEKYYNSHYVALNDDMFIKLNKTSAKKTEFRNAINKHHPTHITFNTNPHLVFQLNQKKCLPDYSSNITGSSFWGSTIESTEVSHGTWEGGLTPKNYLWLAELHRKDVDESTLFGGQTPDAFEANSWMIAGEPVRLEGRELKITYTAGDTYFQRYDCLRTYPRELEDVQTMVEIVSFLCETSINIDGRYDRNRADTSNLVMSPANFNLMNKSYTQRNNYFTYNGLNYNKFNLNYFPNTVTWTNVKVPSELIDSWTNLNFVNTIDGDGSYGKIRALKFFNNEIYGFQDEGIFQLMYNSRVQISPSDGVPIELGTTDTVLGNRYISTLVGCRNKWSICDTSLGIYFIDELSKGIYLFNGESISNISTSKGFKSWMDYHLIDKQPWTPETYLNFTTHFDKIHSNVYFVDYTQCLNYNETLQEFTSFFSYEQVPFMFNVWDRFIMLKDSQLWERGAGDYNSFFNIAKPYYTKFIVNKDFHIEKIFNNIEFIADSFDINGKLLYTPPYNYLRVNTHFDYAKSYQYGVSNLTDQNCKPSSLKQKYRVWKALFPRSISDSVAPNRPISPHKFNKDRIRNPWVYVELGNNQGLNVETNLHNIMVNYSY